MSTEQQQPLSSKDRADELLKKSAVQHINQVLKNDPDVSEDVPIDSTGNQVYVAVSKGVILSKMINRVKNGTIDPKQIKIHPKNAYEMLENHSATLDGATKLGIHVVSISPTNLHEQKPFAFLALIWQIIRYELTNKISAHELQSLRKEGEDKSAFIDLSAEDLLLRWINKHLEGAGKPTIKKFSELGDGIAYLNLLHHIDSSLVPDSYFQEQDPNKRAQLVIDIAKKAGIPVFVTPEAITSKDEKLNMALACQLFSGFQHLEKERSITDRQVSLEDNLTISEEESAVLARKKEEAERKQKEEEEAKRLKKEKKQEDKRRQDEETRKKQEELEQKLLQAEQAAKQREAELLGKLDQSEKEKLEAEEQKKLHESNLRKSVEETHRLLDEKKREEEEAAAAAAAKKAKDDEEKRKWESEEHERWKNEEENKKRDISTSLAQPIEPSAPGGVKNELQVKYIQVTVTDERKNFPGWRKVFVTAHKAKNLIICDVMKKKSNPFVVIKHLNPEGKVIVKHRTKVVKNNFVDPLWNETMEYRDFKENDSIRATIWSDGKTGYDFMGQVVLKKDDIQHGKEIWFPLQPAGNKHEKIHPAAKEHLVEEKDKEEKKKKSGGMLGKLKHTVDVGNVLENVSSARNTVKHKIRGKRDITGEILLAFETIF